MSRIDDLPADRKAVLQLLVKQGKSYVEIGDLLRIDRSAVAERAHDALDRLGPEDAAGLSDERQDEIADYLLGQQSASERAATREFLEGSAAGRAWARVVAGELRPLAGDALPEIPSERAEVEEAFDALEARKVARAERERSSRVGGVLVLAGLGIAVAIALVLALRGGGENKSSSSSVGSTPSTHTTPATSSLPPGFEAQINLTSSANSKTLAVVQVVKTGSNRTLAIAGEGFPASGNGFNYAVWLRNSATDAQRIGFTPPIGTDGRLAAGVDATRLPAKTAAQRAERQRLITLMSTFFRYREFLITRETVRDPARPGPVVVQGQVKAPQS